MRRFAINVLKFVAPALALALGTQAQADPITDLFNTGTTTSTTSGSTLAAPGSPDAHYTLSGPAGGPAPIIETSLPASYVSNTSTSQFVGPVANGNTNVPVGSYIYTTTFTIGSPFTAASLNGPVASDNGVTVAINGHIILGPTGTTSFTSFTAFTDNTASDFVVGTNFLTFSVMNDGGPSALQVNALAGTFTPTSAVPAQASILMLGIAGIASLGLAGFRRLRAA